jgi:hypothetical protein
MQMRIRIIQTPTVTHIDSVRVDCYLTGHTYEVSQTLGEIFLAEEWAEPALPEVPARLPPLLPLPPMPIYSKG